METVNTLPTSRIIPWLLAMRPKTLTAGASPVILASALAWHDGIFQLVPALLCLCFALLCQIGANWVNDLVDFQRGTDHAGRIGPKRMIASGQISPAAMKKGIITIFLIAFVVGSFLIPYGGMALVGVGLACIIAAIAYSAGPFPLSYLGLGDVVDLIFFGLIATLGTYFVQAGSMPPYVWLVALGVGFMINNILLINNTRDRESDAMVNKKTLPVRFGFKFAFFFYRLSGLFALIVGPILWMHYGFGWTVMLPLALYPKILQLQYRMVKADGAQSWSYVFEGTAKLVLLYAGLLALGICLG